MRPVALPLAAAAAALALAACGGGSGGTPAALDSPAAGAPLAVRVQPARTVSAERRVRGTGTFEAQDEVTVAAEVAGRIVRVGPDVGDRVAAAAELAVVDETDYVLLRNQRARALAEALTKLGLSALPEGELDVEALPSVERARLEVANARARHERAVKMNERTPGSVSAQDVADLLSAAEVAASVLRGARLAVLADLAQARTRAAELEVAEQNVRDAVHRAPPPPPPEWVVAQRHVAVGDFVTLGAPLYRLLHLDPLRLVVRIPEARIAGVTPGREAWVTPADAPEPLRAVVRRLRPQVHVATRTVEVEVELPNPGGTRPVGGFAVVEIVVGTDEGVVVVPADAVATFAGVTRVFLPAGGKAAERRVRVGRTLKEGLEILDGLKAGESVIVAPPRELLPGGAITVDAGQAPQAPAGPAR